MSAPEPASRRDTESERTAALLEKHRRRHNDWLLAFIFGVMYWRQVNAGHVVYEMTQEHSRRILAELEARRGAPVVQSSSLPPPPPPPIVVKRPSTVKKRVVVAKPVAKKRVVDPRRRR